ncbi:MAG: hypothetical protein H7317_07630 [Pseudorhodobacter sp.]|nr:hypothetical protein [Pseudorhodobacter sp.]
MTLSSAEQYLLELINRARLDPAAEAARYGIALNAGLGGGAISSAAKQVLAPSAQLEQAAVLHSQWLLDNDVFSHTGAGGSTPGARITAQGYTWFAVAENIGYNSSSGPMTVEGSIATLYEGLFRSADHRVNTLNGTYSEVGVGAETGVFQGRNAVMLTEDFGAWNTGHFLTGVAFADANRDKFYGMGEGTSGVVFTSGATSATTAPAGGYGLSAGNGGAVAVTGHQGAQDFSLMVDMRPGNVKLDLVNGDTFRSSGSVTLGSGVNNLVLLGVAGLTATGSAAADQLTGNKGANTLTGLGGADTIAGGGGADVVDGGAGNDVLRGGAGADSFVFQTFAGQDRVQDFNARTDTLQLDDALWAGQTLTAAQVVSQFASPVGSEVLLEFAGGGQIHLNGVTALDGLAAAIEIF